MNEKTEKKPTRPKRPGLVLPRQGALPLPGLATLFTLTARADRIDVWRDGGLTIIDYKTAEGTYTVRAVFVPTGEAKESLVVVGAGAPARVPFKFSP